MIRVAILVPGAVGDLRTPYQVPAVTNLVARLSEHFDIQIFSLIKPDGQRESIPCGNARVHFVDARFNDPLLRRISQLSRAVATAHRKNRYDLLHAFWAVPCGVAALFCSKRHSIPCLISALGGEGANLPQIDYGNMRRFTTRHVTLQTLSRADRMTVLTQYQLDALKRHQLKRSDAAIIPFGIDTNLFTLGAMQYEPPYRFIHVSNMNRVKDVAMLLRAFKRISERVPAMLTIAGFDLLDGEPHRLAGELGIADRVHFIGYKFQHELPAIYRQSHFLLHTSLYEAQAVTVAEAAACGVVPCGTDVGLLHDLSPDAAVTVEIGNDASMAKSILDVIESPEKYWALREAAIRWATTHTIDWTAERFTELYREMTKKC